jgi:hypothetical protein
MKGNNLQTKSWQSIGLLQWHQLCSSMYYTGKEQKYLSHGTLVQDEYPKHGEKFMLVMR